MKQIPLFLLDLLYPNRCDCCGSAIPYDAAICRSCAEQLCELRISYADWAAQKQHLPWKNGAALYAYKGIARSGILALKDGFRGFGKYAAARLAQEAAQQFGALDLVTWVPVSDKRRRLQGYAHAELLAKEIAAVLQLPARGDLLTEQHTISRQHDLPAHEREQYAHRFSQTGIPLQGQTVLLVDDILTTGSTMKRCTSELLAAGAGSVYIAVVCCAGIN